MTASLEDLKSGALVQGLVGRKAQRILSSEMLCAMAWEMVFRSKVLRLNHLFEQGALHMTWTETFLRDEEVSDDEQHKVQFKKRPLNALAIQSNFNLTQRTSTAGFSLPATKTP